MCAIEFDYWNETITATWSAECKVTDSWMVDAIAEKGDGMVDIEDFKMNELEGVTVVALWPSSRRKVGKNGLMVRCVSL